MPAPIKRLLLAQAGGKCANPGCPNGQVEFHHIQEWHVYKVHDAEHMIALCPSCHDAVDRGDFQITDDELYAWKRIDREEALAAGVLFVEPGQFPRLDLGSMTVIVFGQGSLINGAAGRTRLDFVAKDGQIAVLNLRISSPNGDILVDAVDNVVRQRHPNVKLHKSGGRFSIPGSVNSPWIPEWVRTKLAAEAPDIAMGDLPLLDLRVLEPGVLKLRGCWLEEDRGLLITDHGVIILRPDLAVSRMGGAGPQPATMVCYAQEGEAVFGDLIKVWLGHPAGQ